ncbi:PGDYG domain-containing protein [Fodinisporobacter ferrooxydans]|uniref:PGDYG domain-containing protein n=1 Tax=Fodinisporobacter ferrooxydans TaxID=2901836 RepID=A0ABY4CJW3_9BACL|nr:PGDYG domain-containing protein [Alicyclobacillaceae bacterium MYW30-H2]
MAKYRKKPVVVEAEQWFPGKHIDGVNPGGDIVFDGLKKWVEPNGKYYISTLEGDMEVSPGDYIITGVKGEKYPCKPDIFEATYEKVEQKH